MKNEEHAVFRVVRDVPRRRSRPRPPACRGTMATRSLKAGVLAFAALIAAQPVWSAQDEASADAPHDVQPTPVLVELFTSEACGMCPPADAFVADLAARDDVLPLSLHVTLWDFLGWQDPLAHPEHTLRQGVYNKRLRERGPFTPQMVIDGVVSQPGGKRRRVERSIAQRMDTRSSPIPVTMTMLTPDASDGSHGAMAVRIGVGAAPSRRTDDQPPAGRLLLMAYRSHWNVTVAGGSNAGRTANYVNAVYAIKPLAEWAGGPIEITHAVPMDAETPPGGLAAILQARDQGAILGLDVVTLSSSH